MLPQQYCLRWRYHHSNLQTMFSQLLEREAFCDVTLACEGKTIKAHKIVLSACSTFFDNILSQYEEKDPIVIMKDVKYIDIKCLVEFMYKGEINVDHCHLATLLKTAEELRIKGLAEVSWKDEEENISQNSHQSHQQHEVTTNSNASNGNNIGNVGNIGNIGNTGTGMNTSGMNSVQAALQGVTAVMDSPPTPGRPDSRESRDSNKRKRGRPPIDDYEYAVQTQAKLAGVASDDYDDNDPASPSEINSSWDEDLMNCDEDAVEPIPLKVIKSEYKIKMEYQSAHDDSDGGTDQNDPPSSSQRNDIPAKHYQSTSALPTTNSLSKASSSSSSTSSNQPTNATTSILTAALEKEWPDVVKMNDYLNTGRRQQFWEEPFTKRVMDAIKHKNLEMKIAAELLGVSYGTLYGRYRDAYGCLKHPYRIKDFWTEQGPTDILLKLKRKEITLFRAAEQLNVTPQTLSNYLVSMAVLDNESNTAGHAGASDTYEELDWDDETEMIPPDAMMYQQISAAAASTSNSVLANCPDITIIKKDKFDVSRVNNNSDHSDTTH